MGIAIKDGTKEAALITPNAPGLLTDVVSGDEVGVAPEVLDARHYPDVAPHLASSSACSPITGRRQRLAAAEGTSLTA